MFNILIFDLCIITDERCEVVLGFLLILVVKTNLQTTLQISLACIIPLPYSKFVIRWNNTNLEPWRNIVRWQLKEFID
jgi:hypothetical protein